MKNLDHTLRSRAAAGGRSAPEFWREFEERAAVAGRETYAPTAVHPAAWAGAAAFAAAMLFAVFAGPWGRPTPGPVAAPIVQSLVVPAVHDSVFILEDAEGRGTIVWIGGMPPDRVTGG